MVPKININNNKNDNNHHHHHHQKIQKSLTVVIPKSNANYESQVIELKKKLKEEKNKNQKLTTEIKKLLKKMSSMNLEVIKIPILEDKIKELENQIIQKNKEIENYKLNKNNQYDDSITSLRPGEKIMAVNFVSMGTNQIINYCLPCKNTYPFVKLEEKLYNDYPNFKEYETFFEVNARRIKRFKTLEENNIKNKDVINKFIIEDEEKK